METVGSQLSERFQISKIKVKDLWHYQNRIFRKILSHTVEGQYLNFAGQTDEALAGLQKTLEMEPNFYVAHLFASSAYSEKGMFAEAIVEARTARKLNPVSSLPIAFLGYALAKLGKQAEARALLEELLRASTERYVMPYSIALIYNGLSERDQTLVWLERGFEQRDLRIPCVQLRNQLIVLTEVLCCRFAYSEILQLCGLISSERCGFDNATSL